MTLAQQHFASGVARPAIPPSGRRQWRSDVTRRGLRWVAVVCLLNTAPTALGKNKPGDFDFMRGVTVSCWGWGREWDAPEMATTIREIRSLGGRWISFHPYAFVQNDGSLRHRGSDDDPTVINPIRTAHREGVRVMLKPHIGYWGSRFAWRGAITFDQEAHWKRFFDDYTRFVVTQAKMAQKTGAALFCVGVETKLTLARREDWQRVIEAVRHVYDGPVTYAANWDSYRQVPFWDLLDYIGIQAYFPLTDAVNPTLDQLDSGWDRVMTQLRQFAQKRSQPIVFTELGYNRSAQAAARPWDDREGGPKADQIKLRCMRIALRRIESEHWLRGVFLWKWFPTPRDLSSNFLLQYDEMRQVIGQAWEPGGKSVPP